MEFIVYAVTPVNTMSYITFFNISPFPLQESQKSLVSFSVVLMLVFLLGNAVLHLNMS